MPSFASGMRCFSLALLTVPAIFAQDGDLPERLYLSGERAYAIHTYPEAMETWNQLIQQAPKSPFAAHALLNLARHQVDVEKKPEAALPLLEKIESDHLKSPYAAEAMLLRGKILASRCHGPEDLKEVKAEFNRVVDLFPDSPCVQEARFELGNSFRLLGEWGRAYQNYIEAVALDPSSDVARQAQLQGAETLDLMDDTNGCLRMLQGIRNRFPQSGEAEQAEWRIKVRVKQRIQKPPLHALGPWPEGRQKWLKTPTYLATGPAGELFIFQEDLDRAEVLKDGQLTPVTGEVRGAKTMVVTPAGQVWVVTSKLGVVKEGVPPPPEPQQLQAPSGAALDGWGNLWISDAKAPAIQLLPPEGPMRTLPAVEMVALAALPTGGAVGASDANKALLFFDAQGQTRITVPYGKELPAPFKYVLALASDPLGHVAGLVEGDFEGVVVWGPNGAVLRSATFKSLGISGKFRGIAMDRQGALILSDRSNDALIRIE